MIRAVKAKILSIVVAVIALTIAYGVMVFLRGRAAAPPARPGVS
jgi:predicted RND superfamily exporter protein